jgi:F420-non-reducing hydrogenase iron-sulfur subunit
MENFEPLLAGFLCRWCSYAAADMAGNARMQYPPNLNVIRTMCSGRVDPQMVFKAFAEGADGVLIMGCHPGDCHYKEGNYRAQNRFHLLQKVIEQLGIDGRRLRLEWISATEAGKFVQVVEGMVEEIRKLGPLASRKYVRPRPEEAVLSRDKRQNKEVNHGK